MRLLVGVALCALASGLAAAAQTACSTSRLSEAGSRVAAMRRQLHAQVVKDDDPIVSSIVGSELATLKQALTAAAGAAFACSSPAATPEALQMQLAEILHANLATAGEDPTAVQGGNEIGVYGTDLAVQVFQLFSKPRLFEVDFRYGIACGDDHLLLVFATGSDTATDGWHQQLRWDAAQYKTVGDALGDFVLLTPITGSYEHPRWHYLVAHGHPACSDAPRPSQFDLDLLTPTSDPDRPAVDWHFRHAYTQGNAVPRLATTENTIDFRLIPASPAEAKDAAAATSAPQIFRFHLTADGKVEPSHTSATENSTSPAAAPEIPATH